MKRFHPFFIVGTIGMLVSATLHLVLAWALSLSGVHSSFLVLYPTFFAFLMIGFGLTLKKPQKPEAS